jgi:hypothetical protein
MPEIAIIILTSITIILTIAIIAGVIYIKRQNLLNTLMLTKLNEQGKIIQEMTGTESVFVNNTGKIINN